MALKMIGIYIIPLVKLKISDFQTLKNLFFLDQNESLTCFPGTRTSITTIWEEKTKSDFFHRNPPMPTHCAQWVRIGGHRGGTAENI